MRIIHVLIAAVTVSVVPADPSSELFIRSPASLSNNQESYRHLDAFLGKPPYGGSIAANVYYADSDLCDFNVDDSTKGYPERPDGSSLKAPFILMVDRGDCAFVKMVRNAQRSGAAAVVVADNICYCSDTQCLESTAASRCDTSFPIMADDGSGSDVSIPSMLMFKLDADKVIDELKNNTTVSMELVWESIETDNVTYDLWTTPVDVESRTFFLEFGEIAAALKNEASFTPHMYIGDGIESGCHNGSEKNQCHNLCTNNGRYCSTDPDGDLENGTSGADVVGESLRQICIWKHYGEKGDSQAWWKYVQGFLQYCADSPETFHDDDCIQSVYDIAGIEKNLIDRCMGSDSGFLEYNRPNVFLDFGIGERLQRGIWVIPTMLVNGVAIQGALTSKNVFDAICAGFTSSALPDICIECQDCPDDVLQCITDNESKALNGSSDNSTNDGASTNERNPGSNDDAAHGNLPGDVLESLPVTEFLEDVFKNCGVDIGSTMAASHALENIDLGSSSIEPDLSSLGNLYEESSACIKNETESMKEAFESFKICSDCDMLEIEELWPSALVGVLVKCSKSLTNSLYGANNLDVIDNVPEECSAALLGTNPLGTAIRKMFLHPDNTLPCLESFSKRVPECFLDVWPIPLDGKLLKMGTCVLGNTGVLVEGFCNSVLSGLDACLPEIDEKEEWDCDNVASDCVNVANVFVDSLFEIPASLMGVPLPDSCSRVSKDGDLSGLMVGERYEKYRSECADDSVWPVFESGEADAKRFHTDVIATANLFSNQDQNSEHDRRGSGNTLSAVLAGIVGGVCLSGIFVLIIVTAKKLCRRPQDQGEPQYGPVATVIA